MDRTLAHTMTPRDQSRASPFSVLGWAAYLACSWTWCIGMFLPVLLFRDFGPWSFLVFALPNCVGAGALPFWFRDREHARAFLTAHRPALVAFSAVTIAFQWFFLAWVVVTLGWGLMTPLTLAGAICVAAVTLGPMRSAARWHGVAGGVLLASVALVGLWIWRDPSLIRWQDLPRPACSPRELIPLAIVCSFGFALCPLLDRTFHEANLALPRRASRAAFALGFLGLFPLMIVLTLLYAPSVIRGSGSDATRISLAPASYFVLAHIAAQLAFTIAAHTRIWSSTAPNIPSRPVPAIDLAPLAGIALAIGTLFVRSPFDLSMHEVVYRVFMGFYGLIAPAYIVQVASRSWRSPHSPTRCEIVVLAITILFACPFYFMAFIERQTWWLLIGIAFVVVNRALTLRGHAGPPEPSPAPVPAPTGPGSLDAHAPSPRDE